MKVTLRYRDASNYKFFIENVVVPNHREHKIEVDPNGENEKFVHIGHFGKSMEWLSEQIGFPLNEDDQPYVTVDEITEQ